jgi:uncharacterized protein YjiS (DUF1127 family)
MSRYFSATHHDREEHIGRTPRLAWPGKCGKLRQDPRPATVPSAFYSQSFVSSLIAPNCNCSRISRNGDHAVTDCRQASSMATWESPMVRRYSSGSLARTDTLHRAAINERDLAAVLSESGIMYESISLVVRRDFGRSEATPDHVKGEEGGSGKRGGWSAVLTFLLEGFALYGASVHPTAAFIIEGVPVQDKTVSKDSLSTAERHEPHSIVSPSVVPGSVHEAEHGRNMPIEISALPASASARVAADNADRSGLWHGMTSVLRSVADRWTRWRREREIERTVARLKELDDHTLWDIGIPDRSLIERAARWDRHLWI